MTKQRDAARSKLAILDAAEAAFARGGFDGASIQAIADAAGVSKGTPIYFFGSKEALYAAVIARLGERSGSVIAQLGALAARGEADAATFIRAGVDAYVDFLAANPNFIKLMGREALRPGNDAAGSPSHKAVLDAGRALPFTQGLRPTIDPLQLMLSVMSLCAFPFAQADNLMVLLGADPYDPAFIAARKAHIVDLLLHGALA